MRCNAVCFFLFLLIASSSIFAQANDECIDATPLNDVVNWCSQPAAFSNGGATESGITNPFCFPNNQMSNDIWFSFVAVATDINIAVIGNQPFNSGGTLQNPQFALFAGDCTGGLTEVACQSDAFGQNIAQAFNDIDLIVGATYYLQISARNGNTGTFELCINNFNQIPEPSGDCETAVILCDKSPFSVEFINGVGQQNNELTNLNCPTCLNGESASSWYKWTCDDSGTLTFSLNPLNPSDDLDFVVFELPNGVNDCSGKFDIRCMASGENVGVPFSEWQVCTGATGLMVGDGDTSEDCGCQPGNNNFVSAVDMVAGRSYALVVNNFTNSGSGFSIEFGGTGTFLGPIAAFTTDDEPDNTICIEESITFLDASSFVGTINGWAWSFGPGASIPTADTQGPHTVSYDLAGIKSIVLTIETEEGCLVTEIAQIEVECCSDHFTLGSDITNLTCPDIFTGAIDLEVNNAYGPYNFEWGTGENMEDLSGLDRGTYEVTITDQATCDTIINLLVDGPDPFEFDTLIVMPTCNGGTDGALTLSVTGGTPPYEFNFEGNGFTPNNTLSNISQGDYSVIIRDDNGCEQEQILEVRELELELDPFVEAITPPTCTGFSDGSIVVNITNGLPPYQYNFNDGNGFVGENALLNISEGVYLVEVLDANLCSGFFEFDVQDPPPLELFFDFVDVSCFGESDGSVTSTVTGGVGGYSYQWSNSSDSTAIDNLPAGDYLLLVTDANGCEIQDVATVIQPDPLFIEIVDIVDLICNGEPTGIITVEGSGGVPPFLYSINGSPFQSEPVFTELFAGDYMLTIMDSEGCMAEVEGFVDQPPPLIVDAGEDQMIELGFSTDIRATASEFPVSYQWTPSDFLVCDTCAFTGVVQPTGNITYTITATSEDGCMATDSVTIYVIKNRPIYIPNVFSPNGDGLNDGFTIFGGPAVAEIRNLKIFDRWGELIFDQDNLPINSEAEGWDGKFKGEPMTSAVFVYLAEVQFIDGEVVLFDGDVTLLR